LIKTFQNYLVVPDRINMFEDMIVEKDDQREPARVLFNDSESI